MKNKFNLQKEKQELFAEIVFEKTKKRKKRHGWKPISF